MRPTSSTRSSLIEMSLVARQLGTLTLKCPGADSFNAEFERFENGAHFVRIQIAAQLGFQPIDSQFDRRRRFQLAVRIRQAAHQADAGRNLLAAIRARAPVRGRCWPGPATFRIAWTRRCAASARPKFCERWTPGNSRSPAQCASCPDRSRCAIRRSRRPARSGLAASAITRFDGVRL